MDEFVKTVVTPKIISVSELNRKAKSILEEGIPKLWIEGEISNLARPASGHIYFSLKDQTAQIRCAWFKQRQNQITNNIHNGTKMLALGRISLYEPRGEYQFIIEKLELAGEGDLKRKYEKLKAKLSDEGFFSSESKLTLPTLPNKIGIVTSPSGAAIRDVLSILKRRFPMVPVTIFPTAVQGDAAASQIKNAIILANNRADCDLLILTRGGGSIEDLWPFNEEIVAREIFSSRIPIISAVGHETDVTIADFVADYRAPTPSGAAEIAVPHQHEWIKMFTNNEIKLGSLITGTINNYHQTLDWTHKRLSQSSPQMSVKRQIEQSINLKKALISSMRHKLITLNHRLDQQSFRFTQSSPKHIIQQQILKLERLTQRIINKNNELINTNRNQLQLLVKTLHNVSPLGTLDRGYSIVSALESKQILTNANQVELESKLEIMLAKGKIIASVESKES
jgi:exodeoxyribonuclease VII large subunit